MTNFQLNKCGASTTLDPNALNWFLVMPFLKVMRIVIIEKWERVIMKLCVVGMSTINKTIMGLVIAFINLQQVYLPFFIYLNSNLPCWHVSPWKPGGQRHMKYPEKSLHVPPLRQGSDIQLDGSSRKMNDMIFH